MSCAKCEGLRRDWPIESPRDVSTAIRIAQENVLGGTLESIDLPSSVVTRSLVPILEVDASNWKSDVVHYHFRCRACQVRFELVAETYHGSGGRWHVLQSPVDGSS